MSRIGAASRAAVPMSNARAAASRKNGAKSRGPRTAAGKARSAQNALKHGMRALKFVVLPDEDPLEFAALEAAMVVELAPVGALQTVLARRVAVAAWRLARADRLEVELFQERGYNNASPGLALIRDGNGARSFETLLRYRGAAMAEFWRALRTLKALQAEQAATMPAGADSTIEPGRQHRLDALEARPPRRPARAPVVQHSRPDEPRTWLGTPAAIRPERAIHRRPHPAQARRAVAAERTRALPHPARPRALLDARRTRACATHVRPPASRRPSSRAGEINEAEVEGRRDRSSCEPAQGRSR
jgi:hypothetical protein